MIDQTFKNAEITAEIVVLFVKSNEIKSCQIKSNQTSFIDQPN